MTYTTDKKTVHMPPGMRLTDSLVKTNTGIHNSAANAHQYKVDGTYMNEFKSLSKAAKAVGSKSCGAVSHAITHKTKCKGFYWSNKKKKNFFD